MEDVELMRRIKKKKDQIIILPNHVITSARRWKQEGLFYTSLRDIIIIIFVLVGHTCRKNREILSRAKTSELRR